MQMLQIYLRGTRKESKAEQKIGTAKQKETTAELWWDLGTLSFLDAFYILLEVEVYDQAITITVGDWGTLFKYLTTWWLLKFELKT